MNRFITSVILTAGLAAAAAAQESQPQDSLVRVLQEVVVTARQPATRLVGSTLVSTIAGSNLQNAGNALDVLARLPMLSAEDGSVSVSGKGTPAIYIDGRPMHDDSELRALQSSAIKKVELMHAPGRKTDSRLPACQRHVHRRHAGFLH